MKTQWHKYLVIKEYIQNLIMLDKCNYGEKIPSENELAKQFNMSRQTVRQAINLLENEGWLKSVHGSGTYVNKTIDRRKKETKIIGAIITYPDEYIFPAIIKGIEGKLSEKGYHIHLGFTHNKVEKEGQCLKNFLDKDVDGLIIESTKSALPNPNTGLFAEFEKKNIPYIFINGYYKDLNASFVTMDDESNAFLATDYLTKKGHTKIGGIFKLDDIQGHLRYKGFVKALHHKGIAVLEDSVLWFSTEDVDVVFEEEFSKYLVNRIKNCTALVCYNDQISVKLFEALKQNKISVPQDISIISFDNSSLSELSNPTLTSVSHLGSSLGERAADHLIQMIKTGKSHEEKIKSEIIERSSVKSLK